MSKWYQQEIQEESIHEIIIGKAQSHYNQGNAEKHKHMKKPPFSNWQKWEML